MRPRLTRPILLPGESLSKYASRGAEKIHLTLKPAVAEVEEDDDEDEDDLAALPEIVVVPEPEPVFEPVAETQQGHVTPLKAITAETIAEQREAEVLEEVKEHLAEIDKENEEKRDFEEAERLVYEDKESSEVHPVELAAEDLDEDGEDDEDEAEEGDSEDVEEAEDVASSEIETDEESDAITIAVSADDLSSEAKLASDEGVLPSLGYSAHLRQTDQRFLQQRARRMGRIEEAGGVAGADVAATGIAVQNRLLLPLRRLMRHPRPVLRLLRKFAS